MIGRRKVLIGSVAYLALWMGAWIYGPHALRAQLTEEVRPHWREWHEKRQSTLVANGRKATVPSLPIYEKGPVVIVEKVFCPAPLFFRADCVQMAHGLDGERWSGWYFVTPWRVYQFGARWQWVS